MTNAQLSLFDTNAATGSTYKAGDYVKVRRKPAVAAWVKRGEIFRIDKVHPVNGSLKFWNPHINQWDFLYPEEVKLTVEPVVREVAESIAEPVVGEVGTTELTVEPVVKEVAESIAEPVVGESTAASSIVESVVGESTAASSIVESVVGEPKNYYNSDTGYNGNGWLEAHYKIRRGGKQHSIKCPETGCTGPYYSYRWMEGKRQRAKYCPGNKYTKTQRAIREGKAIGDIIKIISE